MQALQPQASPEVERAIERLTLLTKELRGNVAYMGNKISSVMNDGSKQLVGSSAISMMSPRPDMYSAPLANRIDVCCDEVNAALNDLHDYANRVEL